MNDERFANTCLNKDLPHNARADTELATMTDLPRADAATADAAHITATHQAAAHHRATVHPMAHRHLPKRPSDIAPSELGT